MTRHRINIRIKWNLFLWVIMFQTGVLYAQEIVFEHFSSNNGLSNNLVRDIIQDQDGYLWFATSGGLNRFDGHFFDIYKPMLGDTLSLSDSRISELFLDNRGFIWARSSLGNFHRIDSRKKHVLNMEELGILPPGTRVIDQQFSNDGDLWLILNRGALRIFYPAGSENDIETEYYTDQNQLSDNQINFFYPDISGGIWIGTANGLVRMEKKDISPDQINSEVYFTEQNRSFIAVKELDDEILFSTASKELFRYDLFTKSFSLDKTFNENLVGNVSVIEENIRKEILLGTDNGDVIFFDPSVERYHYYGWQETPALEQGYISEIFADSYGIFWFLSDRRGIYQFNPSTKQFTYFGLNFENRIFLGEPDKQIILEDSNRDIWIGINGGGLFLYNRAENKFNQFEHDPKNNNSISSDVVLSLYEDRSKNLWIGTSYGGINKVSLKKDQFLRISPVQEPETGFDNYIRSVATDPLGNYYVGTKAGKIFVYRGEKKIGTIPDDLHDPASFPATNVYCLYFDNDHNLWVGTKGSGIFVFKSFLGYFNNLKHQDIEVVHINYDPESENSLSSEFVYSIVRDFHGQYWIASFSGGLDLLIDPFENPVFRNFKAQDENEESIVSDEVRHLCLDNDHNLWIATSEGISILENKNLLAETKKFINLRPSLKDSTNLSGKVVYQIMQAKNNDIFAALLDGGINQLKTEDFEQRNFKWIHHTSKVFSPNVYGMEEDNNGDIWMGTDNGLFRLDVNDKGVESYKIKNNMLPFTFSESCSGRTNRNEMIFGSNDGFIYFLPVSIHKDSTGFPLKFSALEINGERINSANSDVLEMAIEVQDKIELNHTQDNITLYFSVLDFDRPDAIRYSYFLEGYDTYWSSPSTVNYANYRQLAPGEYVLHVRGTNSSGAWMARETSITIKIHPPFWKSRQGTILIILFAFLLAAIIVIVVYRQIFIQNKVKVERAITEKRIDYYTNISLEFKTPLSLIISPVEEIIASKKSSDFAIQKGIQIRKNATYLKRLIEQILDFRKLREGKMHLKVSELNLIEFFREIYLVFLPLSKKLNINFIFDCAPEEYMGYADVRQLEKIIFNLLSNAFRLTPEGKTVKLIVLVPDNDYKLKFRVEDQGSGIDEDELPKIFDRFYMSKSSTGIGLFFTKELVFLHKGEIVASNKPEGGSVFTITIPVDRGAYVEGETDISGDNKISFDFNSIDDIETIISSSENEEREHQHHIPHMSSVLIVEDNDEMRKYLGNELSRKFKVLKAEDGAKAIDMVNEFKPDLVLSDVKIPKVDGYELTRAIKDNYALSHIPVILLSAESSDEEKIIGAVSGADDFIVKPFNLNYLITKIENTILQRKKLLKRYDEVNQSAVAEEQQINSEDSEFISEVQELIDQNLSNANLNVEYLVDEMGISRTLFFKKIKNYIGFSPNEYIRITRMKAAARLLISTNKTINEIGYSIGYSDSNYFGKSFKKHFGVTPSVYRSDSGRKELR